jgi:hypothetical protein
MCNNATHVLESEQELVLCLLLDDRIRSTKHLGFPDTIQEISKRGKHLQTGPRLDLNTPQFLGMPIAV